MYIQNILSYMCLLLNDFYGIINFLVFFFYLSTNKIGRSFLYIKNQFIWNQNI